MEQIKTSKNIKNFSCEKCKFYCSKKGDYTRHLLTAKHKGNKNGTEKTSKNIKSYTCFCGKTYKVASGLWKHKIVCNKRVSIDCNTNNNTDDTTTPTNKDQLILDLLAQNKELISILNETVPRIGNTTNNNNNHFNLQVFLNEDCKDALNFSEFIDKIQISFEDLENQAEIGYINGISKLFIENLQELGTHKRPIHCTDKKRKTLYIKENNEWDKEDSQNTLKKGIQNISRKTQDCLFQEKEENLEEYEDIESDFSQKYISIRRSLLPGFPQETTINKVIENISKKSGITE